MPLASFYNPWIHQEMSGFLMFLWGIERGQWHETVKLQCAKISVVYVAKELFHANF